MSYRLQILHGSSYALPNQNEKVQKTELQVCTPLFALVILFLGWGVRPLPPEGVRSTSKDCLEVLLKYISTKIQITYSFLELQTPDFPWKFICTVQPNEKVQKYKKYKSTKMQKYKSTKNEEKMLKHKKHKKYKSIKKITSSLDTAIVSCIVI